MNNKEIESLLKKAKKLIDKYEDTDNLGMEADYLREAVEEYEDKKQDCEIALDHIKDMIEEIEYLEE